MNSSSLCYNSGSTGSKLLLSAFQNPSLPTASKNTPEIKSLDLNSTLLPPLWLLIATTGLTPKVSFWKTPEYKYFMIEKELINC